MRKETFKHLPDQNIGRSLEHCFEFLPYGSIPLLFAWNILTVVNLLLCFSDVSVVTIGTSCMPAISAIFLKKLHFFILQVSMSRLVCVLTVISLHFFDKSHVPGIFSAVNCLQVYYICGCYAGCYGRHLCSCLQYFLFHFL